MTRTKILFVSGLLVVTLGGVATAAAADTSVALRPMSVMVEDDDYETDDQIVTTDDNLYSRFETVTVTVSGFTPGSTVHVRLGQVGFQATIVVATITVDGSGNGVATFTAPGTTGKYKVVAKEQGAPNKATTTIRVA